MKTRKFCDVWDDISKQLPPELKGPWEKLAMDLCYVAPELQNPWGMASHFLRSNLNNPPKEEWEWKVAAIFADKSVEELRFPLPIECPFKEGG